MAKDRSSFVAILSLMIGITLFSTIEIASKVIGSKATVEPFMMVFLRFCPTGVLLTAIFLPGWLKKNRLSPSDFGVWFLNGFIGISSSLVLYHLAIEMFEKASSAAVVFSANALFTVVFAKFINGEAMTLRKWAAVLLGVIGVGFFVCEKGAPDKGAFQAILVMSASAALFALSVCFTKKVVHKYGPYLYMGASSLMGSLICLPFAIWYLQPNFANLIRPAVPGLAYLIAIGTILGYCFYYRGIAGSTAFTASMSFFLKPVLACIFAWIVLQNAMNAYTLTGTLLILVAVAMTLPFGKKAQPPKKVSG